MFKKYGCYLPLLLLHCYVSGGVQNVIKIGILAPITGPYAEYGTQIMSGIKAYMHQHGDIEAGKKIVLVVKDAKGPAPQLAKKLAQDLIMQDKVHFLAGFAFSMDALAVAPLATQAKIPMIVMHAASMCVVKSSPYIIRTSFSRSQIILPAAQWALHNHIQRVYSIVADYPPGYDVETVFERIFTSRGGVLVGQLRVPVGQEDFTAQVAHIKAAKPDGLFIFLPTGKQATHFMKAVVAQGLQQAGIRIMTLGDIVGDNTLPTPEEEYMRGIVSTHHYSLMHPSAENQAFLLAFRAVNPTVRANFMAVAAYDGMAAIYKVIKEQKGKINGPKAMSILKQYKLMSPRGPVYIDSRSRDIVQDIYIRKVKKVNGVLYNVEFDRYRQVSSLI